MADYVLLAVPANNYSSDVDAREFRLRVSLLSKGGTDYNKVITGIEAILAQRRYGASAWGVVAQSAFVALPESGEVRVETWTRTELEEHAAKSPDPIYVYGPDPEFPIQPPWCWMKVESVVRYTPLEPSDD